MMEQKLETGMHSPWVSRLLSEIGHEVIVAHARNVRLIGESRKKDDRLDARQEEWRDKDWFKTCVPDHTPSRPRFQAA
jgi:hypothetical protein